MLHRGDPPYRGYKNIERRREYLRAYRKKYYHEHPEAKMRHGQGQRFRRRFRLLAKKLGISTKEAIELIELAEKSPCAICGKVGPSRIDHDHAKGSFRGFLCDNCNRGIGLLGDDVLRLQAAIAYLH